MTRPVVQSAEALTSHWEKVYTRKSSQDLSWYAPHLTHSLSLIGEAKLSRQASIIDMGAGDSTLADDLLDLGYSRITLLDISSQALERTRARLQNRSADLTWIVGDLTKTELAGTYDLWHDRAVFHFLTNPQDRAVYSNLLTRVLKPQGYALIATFSLTGPETCSGLPTMRYSTETLRHELGSAFRLVQSLSDTHRTPAGREQNFVYCLFQKSS